MAMERSPAGRILLRGKIVATKLFRPIDETKYLTREAVLKWRHDINSAWSAMEFGHVGTHYQSDL
jgi:hypothetical protein